MAWSCLTCVYANPYCLCWPWSFQMCLGDRWAKFADLGRRQRILINVSRFIWPRIVKSESAWLFLFSIVFHVCCSELSILNPWPSFLGSWLCLYVFTLQGQSNITNMLLEWVFQLLACFGLVQSLSYRITNLDFIGMHRVLEEHSTNLIISSEQHSSKLIVFQ